MYWFAFTPSSSNFTALEHRAPSRLQIFAQADLGYSPQIGKLMSFRLQNNHFRGLIAFDNPVLCAKAPTASIVESQLNQ